MGAEAGWMDWQVGLVLLFVVGVLLALLAPVPSHERPPTPSEDMTKTRRLP